MNDHKIITSTELALGSRLKILSEKLYNMVDQIYKENNISFQSCWFPVIYTLQQKGAMGITDIAYELGVTHSAISQLTKKIVKEGLIEIQTDPKDDRRRPITLTEYGKEQCKKMTPTWNDILLSVQELQRRADVDLMKALTKFENELENQNIDTLVIERIKKRQTDTVEIIEYQPKYKEAFKKLNYEWLEKYFYIEKIDVDILSEPETHILNKGGYIFFARLNDEIVGTIALMKHEDLGFELTKMAVTEKYQGLKIGEKLALAVINKAKSLGQKNIFLESNIKLIPALNLYKKLGFEYRDNTKRKSDYQRADIYMVLEF